jgi:hypothetical protein
MHVDNLRRFFSSVNRRHAEISSETVQRLVPNSNKNVPVK